jgi:KipI family sensor histidine kinase inhibitor
MRLLPMGPCATLVELDDQRPAAWAEALRSMAVAGVVEVVPAATTVLVVSDDPVSHVDALKYFDWVAPLIAIDDTGGLPVEVPVHYDGDDLATVAAATGLTTDDVIALHTAPTYVAEFCGFAPGFAYLTGVDPRLQLPRRPTPRTSVPAGAVAVAAGYTAVYPRSSPGGWHLLGTTDLVMFDADREPPALLAPSTRVRFVAT